MGHGWPDFRPAGVLSDYHHAGAAALTTGVLFMLYWWSNWRFCAAALFSVALWFLIIMVI